MAQESKTGTGTPETTLENSAPINANKALGLDMPSFEALQDLMRRADHSENCGLDSEKSIAIIMAWQVVGCGKKGILIASSGYLVNYRKKGDVKLTTVAVQSKEALDSLLDSLWPEWKKNYTVYDSRFGDVRMFTNPTVIANVKDEQDVIHPMPEKFGVETRLSLLIVDEAE